MRPHERGQWPRALLAAVLCACGGVRPPFDDMRPEAQASCLRRLVAEYVQAAPRSAVAEAVETLAGPALLRMVHTRHGALVACYVLAFGTARDRKKAVKAMKGAIPAPRIRSAAL